MKKILTLLIATLLVFSLSGCKSAGSENEFNEVLENMKNMDNYTATVMVSDPTYGDFVQIVKVNGDEGVVNLFDIDFYFTLALEDPTIITAIDIATENTNYYGEVVDILEIDQLLSEATIFNEFEYEDFTFEDGEYKAEVIQVSLTDLSFTVEDDYIDTISYTLVLGTDEYEISVRYFNIGSTSVTIPNYVTDEDFAAKIVEVQTANSSYGLELTVEDFNLTTYETTYSYMIGVDFISFNQLNSSFYPESFTVVEGETTYTVEEYLALETSIGDEALFDLLLELYRMFVTE